MLLRDSIRLSQNQIDSVPSSNPFILDPNGVTIKLKDGFLVGTTGLADGDSSGKTYTAVDNTTLFALDPSIDDFTSVCTTLVTNTFQLFRDESSFNQAIGSWDVSNITNFGEMFRFSGFNQPIGYWDMSSATDLNQMFRGASFNQSIGDWDVSLVQRFDFMFNQNSVFNQPIGDWNTVAGRNFTSMFHSAIDFNQFIGDWNMVAARNFNNMFRSADSFNQYIGSWYANDLNSMENMFSNAVSFNQDLSRWCMTNFTSEPTGFAGNTPAWTLPKPVWGTCPAIDPIASANPVAYFKPSSFVKSGSDITQWTDVSGNNLHATTVGTIVATTGVNTGEDQASFDNASYFDVLDNALLNFNPEVDPFSVIWRIGDLCPSGDYAVSCGSSFDNMVFGSTLRNSDGDYEDIKFGGAGHSFPTDIAPESTLGIAVIANGLADVYIDGVLRITGVAAGTAWNNNNSWNIGGRSDGSSLFGDNNEIDTVAIFNKALTQEEIDAIEAVYQIN